MGFVNGINCLLLVVGPWLIANRACPAPGRAIFAGVVLALIALIVRAAAPVPEMTRNFLPIEALIQALLLIYPRAAKRIPTMGRMDNEQRESGLTTGIAVGRFILHDASALWAALGTPGFSWVGLGHAAMFGVYLTLAHGTVWLMMRCRRSGDLVVVCVAVIAHFIAAALLASEIWV